MNYAIMYGLRPADRIINPIFATGLSKHHAIYLGMDYHGVEWISENYQGKGVRMVRADNFFRRNKKFQIQKFDGVQTDREAAIKRALTELGKPYDLFKYNCEHYAEYVQHNRIFSEQVEAAREAIGRAGVFLIVIGIISLFIKD
jgi:hypothetical protein